MRIGVLTDLTRPNSVYRALPLQELGALGHEVRVDQAEEARFDVLRTCDVVHVYRYHDPAVRKLCQRLQEAGVAIVWDNDDDYTSGPDLSGKKLMKAGALTQQHLASGMPRMAQLADLVTTTNEVLAEKLRAWGAREVRVVENYLPRAFAAPPPRPHAGIVIGWVAGNEHTYDAKALRIADVLREVMDARPEVRVKTIGPVDLQLPRERCEREFLVQYQDLAGRIADFDIAIAPIADIEFNRSRSNVKVKEYAAMGVPWLASPIGPYVGLGEKQGGRLVPDDDWVEALLRLVDDGRARKKLAKRGRKWGEGQTVAVNVGVWEAAVQEASAVMASR